MAALPCKFRPLSYLCAALVFFPLTQGNTAYQKPFYQSVRKVKLEDGGYKGLVVAISPQIPEDDQLIQRIKEVLTNFSSYLYVITRERTYLREVKILIPSTWNDLPRYVSAVSETFAESDIRIDYASEGENIQIRNLPYTNKPTFCGSQGFYIHLTPDYLKDDSISSLYGRYEKVLAHEWAHYRWGVFDEYPRRDGPHFYLSSSGYIEGVRCTSSITGERRTPGGSPCIALPDGFPTDTCRFIDNTETGSKGASLMYKQFLDQVLEYCDDGERINDRVLHNSEAPNMHNIHCASKSVWQVMREHSDFSVTETVVESSPTEFLEVRQNLARYVLVIDTSSSMTYRIRVLRQACFIFIHQVLQNGESLAVVRFNQEADILQNLTLVEPDNRNQFVANLPTIAAGSTSIGSGVLKALDALNRSGELSKLGGRLIIMTDGKETTPPYISAIINRTENVLIHTIAIGDDVAKELESLAIRTGGRQFLHQDASTALIDIFSQFGVDSQDSQWEELVSLYESMVVPGRIVNIEFLRDNTLRRGMIIVYAGVLSSNNSQAFGGPTFFEIVLTSPSGINTTAIYEPLVSMFTLKTASVEDGTWTLSMIHMDNKPLNISILILAERDDSAASPLITATGLWAVTDLSPQAVQTAYLTLKRGYNPVIGPEVDAIVQTPEGNVTMKLYDDGIGEDINKEDGVYSGFFTKITGPGRYNIQFSVRGNGRVAMGARVGVGAAVDPTKAEAEWELDYEPAGYIQRTITGGSFKCSNEITCTAGNIYGPYRVVDLVALNINRDNRTFDLVFSAPGADLMEGTATNYDIRYSMNFAEFRENFGSGSLIGSTENVLRPYIFRGNPQTPLIARSKETFTVLLPENAGSQIYFFALSASDGELVSPPSNIVSVSLRNLSTDSTQMARGSSTFQTPMSLINATATPSTNPGDPPSSHGNVTIILVVGLCIFILVLISLLVMSFLYIHRLKTKSKESSTDVNIGMTHRSDEDVSRQEKATSNEKRPEGLKSTSINYAYAYDHIGNKKDQNREAAGTTKQHTYERALPDGDHYERKLHPSSPYYLGVE